MDEIWKDVEGYVGYYAVSSCGRVKALARVFSDSRGVSYNKQERLLKPTKNNHGYMLVKLCKDNVDATKSVHRLVGIAFHANLENKRCINHVDGNKCNNTANNLEWVTDSENLQHAFDTHLRISSKGVDRWKAKLKDEDIPVIRRMRQEGKKYREIGELFGVGATNVCDIIHGRIWKHV